MTAKMAKIVGVIFIALILIIIWQWNRIVGLKEEIERRNRPTGKASMLSQNTIVKYPEPKLRKDATVRTSEIKKENVDLEKQDAEPPEKLDTGNL